MTIHMHDFGLMRIFPKASFRHAGPLATRSFTDFVLVEWETDLLGSVTMETGMGCYLDGPGGAQVSVRIGFTAGDGTPFFFQYISVGEMESHIRGKTPVMLAGQMEIDPAIEKYAWLNHVQFVGRGMLSREPLRQDYEMAYITG